MLYPKGKGSRFFTEKMEIPWIKLGKLSIDVAVCSSVQMSGKWTVREIITWSLICWERILLWSRILRAKWPPVALWRTYFTLLKLPSPRTLPISYPPPPQQQHMCPLHLRLAVALLFPHLEAWRHSMRRRRSRTKSGVDGSTPVVLERRSPCTSSAIAAGHARGGVGLRADPMESSFALVLLLQKSSPPVEIHNLEQVAWLRVKER
jgi:hypothetical protein